MRMKKGNRKVSDIGTGIFAGYPGYRCYSYNTLLFWLVSLIPLLTICIIEILFLCISYTAWKTGILCLYFPIAVAGVILFFTTNNFETTMFNVFFLIQAIFSGIAVLAGIISIITKRIRIRKPSIAILLVAAILLCGALGGWIGNTVKSEEM